MSKMIHCPNCNYEGKAKNENSGCAQFLVIFFLFIVSLYFTQLFLITIPLFIYFLFQGNKYVCPTCLWKNPIPIKHWKKTQKRRDNHQAIQITDNYEVANSLSKEATQFKKTDIKKSIQLLEKAYNLDPSNDTIAFKLARYYRLDKRNDDSFALYKQLITQASSPIKILSCASLSAIYEQMLIQLYEEKKYSYYIYHYFNRNWFALINLAYIGRFTDNDFSLDKNTFIELGGSTKLKKCLSALKINEDIEKIKEETFNYIHNYLPHLIKVSKISKNIHKSITLEATSKNEALQKKEEFMNSYKLLFNPLITDKMYKEIIQPLIK